MAGAALAPAFGEVPLQRRVLSALCAAGALAGGTWAVVETVAGEGVVWRGFTADPWRALLLLGALVSSAAAVARADDSPRPAFAQAAVFAATAASVAPLVVTGAHLLAVTLLLSTAGMAVAVLALSDQPVRALRGARAIATLALSDALALLALGTAVGDGTALPPRLSTFAASVLLAAALIRIGAMPVAGPYHEGHSFHPAIGMLWMGGVRAQGFVLALFAIGAHRGIAYAAAGAAALSLLVSGSTVARRGMSASLAPLGGGVVLLGLALGGTTATAGAILALGTAFVAPATWAARGTWSAIARASLAAVPAGGLIAGAALVLGAVFGAGAVEPWHLALAVPAATGLVAGCASVWRGSDGGSVPGAPAALVAVFGLAVALAIAAVPARTIEWLDDPIMRTLGVGRLLSAGPVPGVADGLAVVVLGVGLIAFAAGPGRVGSGGAPGRPRQGRFVVPFEWWAERGRAPATASGIAAARASAEARRWVIGAALLAGASLGLAVRVYVAAADRGFL